MWTRKTKGKVSMEKQGTNYIVFVARIKREKGMVSRGEKILITLPFVA